MHIQNFITGRKEYESFSVIYDEVRCCSSANWCLLLVLILQLNMNVLIPYTIDWVVNNIHATLKETLTL